MYSPVFRSRWIALAFVLLMAMGAAQLVGDEEDGGVIGHATEQLIDQRDDFAQQAAGLTAEADSPETFAADEELVEDDPVADAEPDDFGGFEPVPVDDAAPSAARGLSPEEMAASEFVIVDGEVQIVN